MNTKIDDLSTPGVDVLIPAKKVEFRCLKSGKVYLGANNAGQISDVLHEALRNTDDHFTISVFDKKSDSLITTLDLKKNEKGRWLRRDHTGPKPRFRVMDLIKFIASLVKTIMSSDDVIIHIGRLTLEFDECQLSVILKRKQMSKFINKRNFTF